RTGERDERRAVELARAAGRRPVARAARRGAQQRLTKDNGSDRMPGFMNRDHARIVAERDMVATRIVRGNEPPLRHHVGSTLLGLAATRMVPIHNGDPTSPMLPYCRDAFRFPSVAPVDSIP